MAQSSEAEGNTAIDPGANTSATLAGFDSVDQALRADVARSTYGVDGTGIKIGFISTSFNQQNGEATDIQNGLLPPASNIHILNDDGTGGTSDEGRAMAQIIYSIAPSAQLYFSTGSNQGPDGLAAAIAALQAAGCQIICDDINYTGSTNQGFASEPFYQMGDPISKAIDTAVAAGVTYFTMAFNADNSFYESTFQPFTAQLLVKNSGGQSVVANRIAHNFGTVSNPTPYEQVTIPAGMNVSVDLQWDQPFQSFGPNGTGPGSQNSLAWYLYDQAGNIIHWSDINVTGKDPVQSFSFNTNGASTSTYFVSIFEDGNVGAPTPGLFKILISDDNTNHVTFSGASAGIGSGAIFGHALDPNAITVGAIDYHNTPAFGGTLQPEAFSSSGPGEFLFDASGHRLTTPAFQDKVDISAPDANPTSVFGPFFGTSAATPAAAAVGALMLQANGALTPSDIRNLQEDSAIAFGNPNTTGVGLLQADAAVGYAKTLTITGDANHDVLHGTHLADAINAAGGNDYLYGEGGHDSLTGGGGADVFVFDAASLSDAKAATPVFASVTDFDQGNSGRYSTQENDQVDASAILTAASQAGQQNGALMRVVADPTNAHALLQVDADGTANGIAWTTISQLQGLHDGDGVSALVNINNLFGTTFQVQSNDGHFGDFNGDGKADVVWRNDDGTVATWQMNGGSASAAFFLTGVSSDWHIVGTGDFDGDGKTDILWQNDNGSVLYWHMLSASQSDTAPGLGSTPVSSVLAGIGDVDHDGRSDLIWRNTTNGAVTVNTMAGNSTTITLVGNDWSIVGVGDYNGDGKADIMFRNASLGTNAAWLMNGGTVTSTVFYSGVPNDWHVVGTGDFDGNGIADLLWHNDNGATAVWLMNNTGNVQQAGFFNGVSSDWHVAGTGDFDGDLKDDIIWHNDSGATAVWKMNGTAAPMVTFPGGAPIDWAINAHHYDFV